MNRIGPLIAALVLAVFPLSASAQLLDPAIDPAIDPAVGADFSYSTDADDTEVIRAGVNLDAQYDGPEDYLGVRLERAWFNPLGQGFTHDDRAYLRVAKKVDGWNLAATVGTDGHSAIGSINAHDNVKFRKEVFVERDILETPLGVNGGIYYTFAGAALDLPLDDRNVATVVAGYQDFTGENHRLHARATFVHVLKPDLGLSAQLRVRYFRDSVPREFDYYSPRWYVQVLPIIQMRRTTDRGWRLLAAGGVGAQRDSNSDWRRSSYLNAQVTSPDVSNGWAVKAAATFSETPTTSGLSYNYLLFNLGIVRAF